MKRKIDPFVRVEKALTSFATVVTELETAAADHHAVADEAYSQANQLNAVAAENKVAAHDATRRASKIAEFLK